MTQETRILMHLQEHPIGITSYEAFKLYGITRLSAKIFELKEKGYQIDSYMEKTTNRYGEKVHFARYRLK